MIAGAVLAVSPLLPLRCWQVASQVLLHLNRRHAVVRASTYIFCQLIVVGAYFILASIIFYARGRSCHLCRSLVNSDLM